MRKSAQTLSIFAISSWALSAATDCGAVHPKAPSTPSAAAAPCLSIVGWNDTHGQIVPEDVIVDLNRVPAGGVIALAEQLSQIRASGDIVMPLEAGDLFTGPIETVKAEGAPIVEAYNAMGVAAVAIGNHDFDFGPVGFSRATAPEDVGDNAGPDGPRGVLLERMHQAKFPFLSANITYRGGGEVHWPGHKTHVILERGPYRVGVVGYTTISTPWTTLRPNVRDLDFDTYAVPRVAASIRALREAGAYPVVLLAHGSIEGDLPQELNPTIDPEGEKRVGEMATLLSKLGDAKPDLVIAGHRHGWMLGKVMGVPMVSSDQHGAGVHRIRYCMKDGAKLPVFAGIERRVSFAAGEPPSPLATEVRALMEPWRAAVRSESDRVVTMLATRCEPHGQRGTAFGEQMARAIAMRVNDAAPPPAGVPVVGLTNAGALRVGLAAGPVRYSDLFLANPFENMIAACETTVAGIKQMVRNGITRNFMLSRLPFAISGARAHIGRGMRSWELIDVTIGEVIYPANSNEGNDNPVWLALPDFVLTGGDGLMSGVKCKSTKVSSTRVRDALGDILAKERGGCEGPAPSIRIDE